jgi:hypothetical protein
MVITKELEKEIEGLSQEFGEEPEEVLRNALKEFHLRKLLSSSIKSSLHKMYVDGTISKEEILIFLPEEDAEEIIIGDRIGKEGAKVAKRIWKKQN